MDEEMIKGLKEKMEGSSLTVDDIPNYLTAICQIANENDDIKEEVEGWEKLMKFEVEDGPTGWMKVADGVFTAGDGDPDGEPDLTLQMNGSVGVGIFSGDVDATSAYMAGDLKVVGPLPDAVKFRTITEMVREAIEDM